MGLTDIIADLPKILQRVGILPQFVTIHKADRVNHEV